MPSAGKAATGEILLEANDLEGTHDDIRTLFKIERLQIRRGQKMAVVGSNGCGKSTLLTALAGKSRGVTGKVQLQPGSRVAVVEQATDYDPEKTVAEIVLQKATSPQAIACRAYRAAALKPDDTKSFQNAMEAMDETNAWAWEEHATKVMHELGLNDELQQRKISETSGGEERRVALASAMVDIQGTDLLILDEPTNHLSAEGCDWLQERLNQEEDLSVVLVTHDRYFLDEVCDEILEIDGLGSVYSHPGSWQTFLERRGKRFADRASTVDAAKTQLKRAEAWMARGARGRGTKNKAQISGYHTTKDQAEAIISADDGAPELSKNFAKKNEKSGSKVPVLQLVNATVTVPGRGDIFKKISFSFQRGQKIGVSGPNGAGKSTFLKTLAGELELDEGTRTEDYDLRLGYLSQEPPPWKDPTQRVMQVVAEMAEDVLAAQGGFFADAQSMSREKATAQLLRTVNFAPERWQTQVQMLSGGERRRVQLLRVLASNPNVLLMDEPTNDLDAVTVDALERLLQDFEGTIVLVSHDRSLLDGVCNMHLVLERGKGMKVWQGSHAELREFEKAKLQRMSVVDVVEETIAPEEPTPQQVLQKQDFKEDRNRKKNEKKFKKVEEKIEKMEQKLAQVGDDIQKNFADPDKMAKLVAEQQKLEVEQEALYEQWEELGEALAA